MLDTLQKMSGTTHKVFKDSKTITRDMERIWLKNEGKASYTMTAKEVPVISYNDMAFIGERNSIVFRAGDAPVWNRNETILPMSWRLYKDTISQPGKEYTLQTIPTLSSAVDFDVRKNQPDFTKMLDKRMNQAYVSESSKDAYQRAYGYTDYEIEQLDPDNYADEVMDIINQHIRDKADVEDEDEFEYEMDECPTEYMEENKEQLEANAKAEAKARNKSAKKFAGGLLSPDSLNHSLDTTVAKVYCEYRGDMERDTSYFLVRNGNLCGLDGTVYIRVKDCSEELHTINEASKDSDSNVYSESDISQEELHRFGTFEITDDFYRFLAGLDSWKFANGRFEEGMKREMMDS